MLFYRVLVRLYPKSFRNEYGAEMMKDFARGWREASAAARLALVAHAAIDVGINALGVHLDILRQDLGYSIRSLRRTPGFTITAVLVAAIGIGATTAAFSIADHVLIRPFPFADPDGLVTMSENHAALGYPQMEPSPPNYRDWKRLATSFESVEAIVGDSRTLIGSGEPERVSGSQVTGGVFSILGRQAALGRALTESDVTDPQNPVVISDRFWRTRFAADPTVLGRTMTLDAATLTVVGVMPADFFFPGRGVEYWRGLRLDDPSSESRNNNYLMVMARLKPAVSLEQARSEMRTIADQIAQQYPKEQTGKGVNVVRWRDSVAWQTRQMLWALVGASLCVLLIACTNLANLLMSRALARRT